MRPCRSAAAKIHMAFSDIFVVLDYLKYNNAIFTV